MMNNMVNCANSTTTGVILGATSTMPIGEAGENGGISGILNSATMLNKDMTILCSMKTSMFKWKPELEVAVMAYDQAAACFKLAKEYELCIEACIQVSVAANRRDLPHTRIKRTPSVCLNSVCTHSNG